MWPHGADHVYFQKGAGGYVYGGAGTLVLRIGLPPLITIAGGNPTPFPFPRHQICMSSLSTFQIIQGDNWP